MRPAAVTLVVLCVFLLGGCTSAAFLAANLPPSFGRYLRSADLPYGPEPRQQLDVYGPEGATAGPRSVIVFFHGGSWSTGSRYQYRFVGDRLAAQGFIAVLPDYRLNPAVSFPVFMDDAARAVAWTLHNIDRYGGDPARVFVMGHSAGAHMAALLALDRRYLAAQGASADELRGAIGLSGAYDFAIDSPLLRSVFGSATEPLDTQPVQFARGDGPPLLLIHGTDDRICEDWNSIVLTERVRAAGGEAELRLYPGAGHGDTVGAFAALGRGRSRSVEDVAAFVATH
jgi:acetyl esterase/lipase